MKASKKILPVLLAGALVLNSTAPVFAASASGTSTEKEEVIYANMDSQGSVKEIYAVNIFSKGDVVDYGDYSSVSMLNTNDTITRDGDQITFSTTADRAYCKGTMKTTEIPWNVSIRYYLDGEEYSASEIAGKSGALKIRFQITQNPDVGGNFYDNYALQANFTLNTEKCSNIAAGDATLANVGKNKQLSYTILPGKGIDTTITADVTDFEMPSVSINGIPLSLNVEVDDEELLDRINELLDAIGELDDGAGELQDGAYDLKDGAENDLQSGVNDLKDGVGELHDGVCDLKTGAENDLQSGVNDLKDGAGQLQDGAAELEDGGRSLRTGAATLYGGTRDLNRGVLSLDRGIQQVQAGLFDLDNQSIRLINGSSSVKDALLQIQQALHGVSISTEELRTLASASSEIQAGIDELATGASALQQNISFTAYKAAMLQNGLDIDALKQGNTEAISSLSSMVSTIEGQITYLESMGQDTWELQAQAEQLKQVIQLLQGNNASIDGTEAYLAALNAGMQDLVDGANTLRTKYAEFDAAINQLVNTLSDLLDQMTKLSNAIDVLVTEYSTLDGGIRDYTGGVAQIIAGYRQLSSGSTSLVQGSRDLVDGSGDLYDGTTSLLNGIVELHEATGTLKDGTDDLGDGVKELIDGISDLYDGAGKLKDGTGDLDDGVQDLLDGIFDLYDGTGEMKDGTSELRSETDGMDTEVTDKIDEMLESITGGDMEMVSFVSEKNTNVDAVQFVLQTEAIEIPKVEDVQVTAEKPLNFWQKLLRLFGLY